jgi:hypothetical protein
MLIGACGALAGILIPAASFFVMFRPSPPKQSLHVKLDSTGEYVIAASHRSVGSYTAAIDKAVALHPNAKRVDFEPQELNNLLNTLRQIEPRYVLVFIQPDELDVNFGWRWLTMASQLDDDPFVDVRTGFITGATPKAAEEFVDRVANAVAGKLSLPGACVDNLGPAEMSPAGSFNSFAGAMMLPSNFNDKFSCRSISHAKYAFTGARLTTMEGAGVIHFGGHGHPDQIDDGLKADQLPQLKIAPSIVFNGACYTGVTHRWYDQTSGTVVEKNVDLNESFCLKMLQKDVVAYLAALHPDHGMPVYQEMEFLACAGASLGDVMKHTYDGVVMGAGGKLPDFETLTGGSPAPVWSPADIMLKGTAARILLGDPALVLCNGFLPQPFAINTTEQKSDLRVTATLSNPQLKSTYTDTYHNDLNPQAPFNDRALIVVDLPKGFESHSKVEVVGVNANKKPIAHRLVGYAIEKEGVRHRLHVQVDVPAQGFQQSAFRVAGASVELVLRGE